VERTQIFLEFDLNEYSELATLLSDRKDFCGDGSHMCHFLRQTSPEMASAFKALGTDKHHGRREFRTLAPLTLEVERNRNVAARCSSFQVTNIFLNFSNDLAALARLFKGSRDCGDKCSGSNITA
jgi:hypothetical protein